MKTLIVIISFIVALILHSPAHSQTLRCAPYDVMTEGLKKEYGETPRALGISANGALISLYASQETGTWTITTTHVTGTSCLIALGHSFDIIAAPVPGDDR